MNSLEMDQKIDAFRKLTHTHISFGDSVVMCIMGTYMTSEDYSEVTHTHTHTPKNMCIGDAVRPTF